MDQVKALHKANNIDLSKATHATWVYAAKISCRHGSSVDDTKALSGWNDKSGAFKPCYDHKLPLLAPLRAAMFNGAKPESHFLLRHAFVSKYTSTDDVLTFYTTEPPDEATSALFP